MKKIYRLFIGLSLLVSCNTQKAEVVQIDERVNNNVPGIAIVQFDSQTADFVFAAMGGDVADNERITKAFAATKSSNTDALLKELGISEIQRVFPYSEKWEKRHREFDLHTFFRVKYNSAIPETKAQEGLLGIEGVIEVEAQPKIKRNATVIPFNDSYRNEQWALYNPGTKTNFTPGIDINIIPVWNEFTTGSSDVIISVVDEGININHPDLKGVVIPGTKEGGSHSFVYGHEGIKLTNDDHGTHVTAIIAGINNNKIGICGVAGGNNGKGGVKILGCQIMEQIPGNDDDSLQGNSAEGIVWGADNGAVISQNSWGYGPIANIPSADRKAIDYFIQNAGYDIDGNQVGPMAGGVVFFAAGNEKATRAYPAMYDKVIAVGAIGPNGKRASYSNYGSWVDICAPGGEFVGYPENRGDSYILSASGDGSYLYMCGTSQACPFVSGVAALLVSHFGGKGFTNDMLITRLLGGANYETASKSQKIGPMLDAAGAFYYGEEIPELEIVADCGNEMSIKSHESISVTISPTNESFKDVNYSLNTDCEAVSGREDGENYILDINALQSEPGIYNVNIKAESKKQIASINIRVTILENHAPIAKQAFQNIICENKDKVEIDLSQYFEDIDGEDLKFSGTVGDKRIVRFNISSENKLILFPSAFGQTSLMITAKDARGAEVNSNKFDFLLFDKSKGAETYPNPVSDYLYIGAGIEKEMDITIFNSNGTVLLKKTDKGSSFSPIKVDMRDFAPGVYKLHLSYGDTEIQKTIVKK